MPSSSRAAAGARPSPARKRGGRGFAPSVRVAGVHLELHGVMARPARTQGQGNRPVKPQAPEHPTLQISVPKRLVRAAVHRNTVKRVLREAWRQALDGIRETEARQRANPGPASASVMVLPSATAISSTVSTPVVTAGVSAVSSLWADLARRSWRFRLKAHPLGKLAARSQFARAQMRQQARRVQQKASASTTAHPGFAGIKRQLRAEADQLLVEALSRLCRSGEGRSSSSRRGEESY
ncbi:MAG: ribonuclease P protein component [Lautropia sp.]|nr:ribonuclease P protein component [Lautropia sp.]